MSKLQGRNGSTISPWGQGYWPYIFFVLLGLFTADLVVVGLRDQFLPKQAPPAKPVKPFADETPGRGAYQVIITRNIFSGDNIIPDPLKSKDAPAQQEAAPVLSSLPLALVGTLVHSNPEKSIASIEVKGKGQVLSFSVKQDIDNIATVESIERGKVIIRNTNNGRLEYIELPQQSKLAFESARPTSTGGGNEIKQVSEGQYELKKADLDKYLSDLPNLLMQARAVPARRPGTGETYGFRVLEVQPNSVLAKIVKPMDVIKGVNGAPVTSIQQAMEMYNAMRNSPRVCITVERDGRDVENCYTIR